MIEDSYKTLEKDHIAEGFYKEKGSKFIAYAFHVKTEDDIRKKLEWLRKEHYAARHHCYAWRLGPDGNTLRANDDGEPGNSAGKPILGQLQAFELTNTLAVVVRYFGGTKLGVGGLIHAYKEATADALREASIEEKTVDEQFIVSFGYPEMNTVMRILKELNPKSMEQKLELTCEIHFSIRKRDKESVFQKFSNLKNIHIKLVE
jgi:uncharacterized YigZ family protein